MSTSIPDLAYDAYFRGGSLGEGAFGAVMAVFDNDGNEFAAKRFEESEDGDLDAGTLKEIAVLRLLSQGEHPNIIKCLDISEVEEGALAMILPK